MFTRSITLLSTRMVLGKYSCQSSQAIGFQEYEIAEPFYLVCILLLIHYCRHSTCTYFTDPVHLQGDINGFSAV